MTKTKKTTSKNQPKEEVLTLTSPEIVASTHRDMLFSALFISVLINITIFITWLVLRVTSQYDPEVVSFLFS